MKILQLAETYYPYIGGTEGHTERLAKELADRGHGSVVATLTLPGQAALTVGAHGERVHRLDSAWSVRIPGAHQTDRPFHPPVNDPGVTRGLKRVIEAETPEIVIGNNWMLYSYLPLARLGGPPTVAVMHDYGLICPSRTLFLTNGHQCDHRNHGEMMKCAVTTYGRARGPLIAAGLRRSQRSLHPRIDRFIAVSRAVADATAEETARRPVEVVPTFVDNDLVAVAEATPRPGFLPPGDFILFVGAMSRMKGIDILLAAYDALGPDRPRLVVLGMPKPDTPRAFPGGVTVRHNVAHAQVMSAWRFCLFGVVPSVGPESFGQVALEALSVGRPVIASRVGGLRDVVLDGETGLLVEPGDVIALTEAMRRLLNNPERREAFGAEGARRAREFTVARVTDRLVTVYADALGDGGRNEPVCRP